MRRNGILIAATLMICLSQLKGQTAQAASLTIIQPSTLAEEVSISASLGNFGHITYGQTIMGKVIVAEGDNSFGCSPLNWGDFPTVYSTETPDDPAPGLALFVMVDRGRCSNPTKVRNVENFGGAIALISDYEPEDMEDFVMVDYGGAG